LKPTKPPDRAEEFAKLADTDARMRRQFIETEIASCRVALEIGEFELSAGEPGIAAKELATAEKIVRVIQKFLPRTRIEHRSELTGRLADLQAQVDGFRDRLSRERLRLKRHVRAR
jgi:hypothetical protein